MNKIKTNTIILIVVGVLVAAIAWKVFGNANAANAASSGKKQNGNKKQNQGTSGQSGSSEAPADGDGAASSFFGRK